MPSDPDRRKGRARGDLTDDEWALVEPHLPLGERGPIPDLRRQFNAVMWRFRTGSPWRAHLSSTLRGRPFTTGFGRGRSWASSRP
ncbi:transposase [Streptosporangium canum]|uniref:transposase n=1 Tax=Streptosporangium canum TaxID=324952 RepID=UPI000B81F360